MTGLLIFIGMILVILNVIAIKKQGKSFDGALGNAIVNINDYDIKLGEIRREFSESIVELQGEMMVIREMLEGVLTNPQNTEKISDDAKSKIIIDEYNNDAKDVSTSIITNTNTNTSTNTNNGNEHKVQEIKKLFSEGLSAEEISEVMQLGKGEVLLIKDLYIR
jgi:hypothetical protein